MEIIKSYSQKQHDILMSILTLHTNGAFEVDLTYGNGSFYRGITKPAYRFDIQPLDPDVEMADSGRTPLKDNSVNSVVFDPPFLTYIRQGREHNSIMAKRYGGYWNYEDLESHYKRTLVETHRILEKKGIMVFKCQDIIHNHRMHATHINVVNWATEIGFRLKDIFVLVAPNRINMPSKKGDKPRTQKHARIHHSYFLVLERM